MSFAGSHRFASGAPLVAISEQGRVSVWNEAVAELTGTAAREALGRPCWEVLRARDASGTLLCTSGCGLGRFATAGEPPDVRDAVIPARGGYRHVALATVTVTAGGSRSCIHLLTAGRELTPPQAALARDLESLTARQRDVLALLAEGVPAKVIALRLGLAERTVRNYIREILLLLRCRSQLEALAKLAAFNRATAFRDAAAAASP
jgi:PAS domain S-box-containing protein